MLAVRVVIGIIVGLGIAAVIANFVYRGVDVPSGLLALFGLVFGALFVTPPGGRDKK